MNCFGVVKKIPPPAVQMFNFPLVETVVATIVFILQVCEIHFKGFCQVFNFPLCIRVFFLGGGWIGHFALTEH